MLRYDLIVGIRIERVTPERGTTSSGAAAAGSCCCCCCLHTVGSVIGALSARSVPVAPEPEIPAAVLATEHDGRTLIRKTSVAGLYWALVAIATGLFVSLSIEPHSSRNNEIAVGIAMVLPGLQLAASLVACGVVLFSKHIDRHARLVHLWRITLRTLVGGLIGLGVMIVLFKAC